MVAVLRETLPKACILTKSSGFALENAAANTDYVPESKGVLPFCTTAVRRPERFPSKFFFASIGSTVRFAVRPDSVVVANPPSNFRGNPQMSEHIHHVTDDTFEPEVLQSQVPVLVDYWAEWCGPCKMIAPILDEVATEYSGRLKIAKLNIDENQGTPPKYGIRGIPTLMIFKNGNIEATKVGAVSKSQLTAFIDSNI
jgi:thioredoxin 1